MSEYQYYEFRAIDRPLTEAEQDHLGTLSSRAKITRSSFTNTYNYGDFRGNPNALMDRYFGAFVYVSNWGTNRLVLRVPRRILDADTVIPYTDDEFLTVRTKGDNVILDFSTGDEDGGRDWVEGEGWLDSLIGLRDELLQGDHRVLYLGWLASFRGLGWLDEDGSDDDDPADDEQVEPPVPPGLGELSAPLRDLAEFLQIDANLIAAAAESNTGKVAAQPTAIELTRWLQKLPAADKDFYLLRFLMAEGDVPLRAELMQGFRVATGSAAAGGQRRRTVAELLLAWKSFQAEAQRREAERKQAEKAQRDRESAEARTKRVAALAPREAATWDEVAALIATKLPKNYDRAVDLLVDLRDLARRVGRETDADAKVRAIRLQHATKPSLMKRFDQHGLGLPG